MGKGAMGKGAMGRPSLHSQHEQLLPTKVLRGVVLKMHDAFPRLCAAWNEENAMRKNWALLFSRLDTDGSGRLDYWEFRRALIDVLEISITEKEAKGLWAYVDHDKSGLVSIKEFQHACYLLILDDWPRLDRRTLTRLCGVINDAAVHEYSKEGDGTSSGNWFKIFGHFDTDESGRLGWEELEQVSRRRDPGLNLSEEKITLNELRGLWRAIDIDCSGDVTVDEFMPVWRSNFGRPTPSTRPCPRNNPTHCLISTQVHALHEEERDAAAAFAVAERTVEEEGRGGKSSR